MTSLARVVRIVGFGSLSFFLIGNLHATAGSHLPPAPPPIVGATPPPPPPPITERELKVFLTANGQVTGPFNKAQLQAKIASGELNRTTLIWMEGMSGWQAAATVQAVAPLMVAAPPPAQFDAKGFHTGTWESSGTFPLQDGTQAQLSQSMTYRPDGSVTGFGQMSSQHAYGTFVMNLASKGTWSVQVKTDNSYILTTNLTITGTSRAGPPTVETAQSSILFTIIDRNTIATQDGARSYRTGN